MMQAETEHTKTESECCTAAKNNSHYNQVPLISIVVPCFNEENVIELFIKRISEVLNKIDADYELLFINDGSTDNTIQQLIGLAQGMTFIKIINLSRNFGKEAALSAGLDHACGDIVIPMDADLQDPPELIFDFLEKWREGF